MNYTKVNSIISAFNNCGFSDAEIIQAVNNTFTLGKLTSEECDYIFDARLSK